MTSHQIDISEFEKDPRLFLFTSLTAGSSHIITATSRMETILKANKIPFQAIDLATDEKARRLWQRRARERKLPGLVKDGFVLGDLDEIEEWNEFGELKENIGNVPAHNDTAGHTVQSGVSTAPPLAVRPTATQGTTNISTPPVNKAPRPGVDESKFRPLPGAAEMAERNKPKPSPEQAAGTSVVDENAPPKVESMTSAPKEKEESINAAKKLKGEEQMRGEEHLSAPPSAMQSGTATPNPEPAAAETAAAPSGDGEDAEKLGGEVKAVPDEEVKKVEGESSSAEAADEGDEGKEGKNAEAATAVEATDAGEGKDSGPAAVEATDAGEGKDAEEVKEQGAKEGEDAGKSVGD